jgi:hypothetical protein
MKMSEDFAGIMKRWNESPELGCNYCGAVFKGNHECDYDKLKEKVQRYERAINKSIMQIDLVHTDESDADAALNYVFKYLKEVVKGK